MLTDLKLYDLNEISKLTRVTKRTLLNYVKQEKIKAVKIGGKWQVTEDNLRKYITGEK